MDQQKLEQIFNRFAGKEVPLVERTYEIGVDRKKIKQLELLDPCDPVISEIRQAAYENNLRLRVWWPGVVGTMDYRTDRVNVKITKDNEGKWRVSGSFSIG